MEIKIGYIKIKDDYIFKSKCLNKSSDLREWGWCGYSGEGGRDCSIKYPIYILIFKLKIKPGWNLV